MPGERKARTDGMKSWSDLSKQKVFKKDEPIMMYENWWTASKVQMESGLKLARKERNYQSVQAYAAGWKVYESKEEVNRSTSMNAWLTKARSDGMTRGFQQEIWMATTSLTVVIHYFKRGWVKKGMVKFNRKREG